ncbi:RNA polymerase sigma factor, sigma-70 family [Chitinophaga costaii]|uniref:RNA polymerase sigma factor, sigma-70 family n=1 Tax=Chitinophaga costaii TaxID=1335309 RepID=A0A1C4AX55_9BACT|nr:sigma-70 family RNA polymerase sigma factor [Chitinophaga costaii]PUZ26783.1 sigma-70 family RNA polymerase sigma factor [Chitinophaga costaii]SCB99169.1 RNA polymerase sigma factor, sigma-70 family [Chitinophaga costaii]
MYASLPDKVLWSKLMEGDRDALAFIYKTCFGSLFRFGMKISPDENLVQDCIHDIFVTLWLSRERLSPTDNIKYYLLASLKRKITGEQQRLSDRLRNANTDLLQAHSPEEVLIGEEANQELRQKLNRVLDQLPRRQQEILYLRFYEGLDPQQTANIMGLSLNSTYVLLSKALNYLKKHSDQLLIISFFLLLIGLI